MPLPDLVAQLLPGNHALLQALPDQVEEKLLLPRIGMGRVSARKPVITEQRSPRPAQPVPGWEQLEGVGGAVVDGEAGFPGLGLTSLNSVVR